MTNSIKIVSDTCFRVILIPWLFVVRITTGLCCNWGFVDFHFLISHLSRVECNIFAFRSRFKLLKNLRQFKSSDLGYLLIWRRLFSIIELIQINKHFLSKIKINLLIAKAHIGQLLFKYTYCL